MGDDRTYWHMQMHPNNIRWGKEDDILEKNIIGIGDWNDKKTTSQIENFKSIRKGDIVLVRRGATPLALVEVKSEEIELGDGIEGNDWIYYKHNIERLDDTIKVKSMPKFSPYLGTLQKLTRKTTKAYIYIDNWYKETLEDKENNKIINIEEYQENFTISIQELKIKLHKTDEIKHIDILNFYKESINNIETIDIEVENLKSIKKLNEKFTIKLDNGLYTIVGNNGIGKSALLISLGHLIKHTFLQTEFKGDSFDDSKITYTFNNLVKFEWKKYNQKDERKSWTIQNRKFDMPKIDGFFESGIISGSRFEHLSFKKEVLKLIDTNKIKNDMKQDKKTIKFVKGNLDYIINGKDINKYDSLFTEQLEDKLQQNIYFYKDKNNKIISEYSFSTGEYFVLALLKFIATKIDRNKKSLIIIDEIDISLHPLAQKRLLESIKCFKDKYNITFIIATHSLQIIENLKAENIFYFENKNGNIIISNPIYPAYVTKDIYEHQYYDKVLLVEDILAQSFLEKVIKNIDKDNKLREKLHYKIFAIGDWRKVLEVARDNDKYKYYPKARVLPILDEDVNKNDKSGNKQAHAPKWKKVEKTFIPIEDNIEKYTVTTLLKNDDFIKMIESDLISPNKFTDLNIYGNESNTEEIKNKFNYGILKQISDYSSKNEKEIIEEIIEFIFQLKVKSNDTKYEKFEKTLKIFLELN
jgi:ABC-type dipeptide/oligopeptide/nickel transport system ATPase subunit